MSQNIVVNNPKNSWKINLVAWEDERFDETHFLCTCDNHQSVSYPSGSNPELHFKCRQCNNEIFHDFETFLDTSAYLIESDFEFGYKLKQDAQGYEVEISYDAPLHYSKEDTFMRDQVAVFWMSLSYEGKLTHKALDSFLKRKPTFDTNTSKASKLKSHLTQEAKKALFTYAIDHLPAKLVDLDKEQILGSSFDKFSLLEFFLRHDYVRDAELFMCSSELLSRLDKPVTIGELLIQIAQDKSHPNIMQALFASYERNKKELRSDLDFNYIIIQSFEDEDFIIELLSQPLSYKKNLFRGYSIEVYLTILKTLEYFYTQKELFELFYQATLCANDAIQLQQSFSILAQGDLEWYEAHFKKEDNSVSFLYESISRLKKERIDSYKHDPLKAFKYEAHQIHAQTKENDLDFKLPQNFQELQHWSELLNNRIFADLKFIVNKERVIYGVFKDNQLLYAVKIEDNEIIQARTISNKFVPTRDMRIIDAWNKNSLSLC